MLEIKLGVNLEVKWGVGSKTGSKNSVFEEKKSCNVLGQQHKTTQPFGTTKIMQPLKTKKK